MADAVATAEQSRLKEMWRQFAFLAATVMNSSGKTYRRTIKPDDLLSFSDGRKRMTDEERERRRAEAMETLRLHKAKFWTKFKDSSVAKLTGE